MSECKALARSGDKTEEQYHGSKDALQLTRHF